MFKVIAIAFCCFVVSEAAAGKSTRYWDCCKPSCSWSGKAALTKGPANTCLKDGVTIDTRGDAGQNGCTAGASGSFMCASNQPWAVNSNLAYGFAAANIVGGSEATWCCACYQLNFTSSTIVGKQMIVQVTNTGSDLGGGHFDIQIPGGGVGIFNTGCTSQYNAPINGWGSRYGGISSQSQCSQLPTALQPGCNWRFTWYNNADNPNYNFIRVKCPAALTAKTNCIRADENTFSG